MFTHTGEVAKTESDSSAFDGIGRQSTATRHGTDRSCRVYCTNDTNDSASVPGSRELSASRQLWPCVGPAFTQHDSAVQQLLSILNLVVHCQQNKIFLPGIAFSAIKLSCY